MKAICFKCHFVGIGVEDSRCPECGFPLIVNTASVPLASGDIERMFARRVSAPPLPGVNPEPRKAMLLQQKRKERIARLMETRRRAARKAARRRLVGEVFAAGALLVGVVFAINALL